jgi:glycosyltransferase involved in cell wall biosynthesis
MILSILICSLHSRSESLKLLLEHLHNQIEDSDLVEILTDVDNKEKSTGKKRNDLVNRAKGQYIVFIDDDDWVNDYYVQRMLLACMSGCDCVAINGKMTTDGGKEIAWRLSKDYENITVKENSKDVYLRKTNHITAVKRELALKAPFPNKSNAEDKSYSDAVNQFLKTEHRISLPMYHYRFSTKNKEY